MPTPAERQALLFVAAVIALGAGVRTARAVWAREPVPAAAQRALEDQLDAVIDAREREAARRQRPKGSARKAAAAGGAGKAARPTAPAPPAPPALPEPPIDVDRAPAAELDRLPRVGPALAARIVADRDSCGPFGSLEALQRVRGIGPGVARELQGRVTFSGTPRPLCAGRTGSRRAPP